MYHAPCTTQILFVLLKRARHYFYISARECIATLQPRPPSRPEGRLCHLTVADGQQSVLSWVSEIRRTTFSTALETYPILSSLVPPNLLINPGSRFLYLLQVFILKDVFEAICLLYIFHLPIIYTHIYISSSFSAPSSLPSLSSLPTSSNPTLSSPQNRWISSTTAYPTSLSLSLRTTPGNPSQVHHLPAP